MTLERIAALTHDVGKYIARSAQNLPPGPLPPALFAMLERDLYQLDGTRSALEVFQALSAGLEAPELERARTLLEAIEALEARLRARDERAARRAATLALEVRAALRDLLVRIRAEGR